MFRLSWISIVLFVAALLLSSMLVDHGTVEVPLRGPGLTIDESFNIQQGVYLVDALVQHGPLIFSPSGAQGVFGSPEYLPDHPPLGRVVLGVSHYLTSWCIPGSESTVYNVPAARLGSCFAFAMTVFLLSEFCRRRYGWASAVCVAILMNTTPGLIGHARLAALESATNLAWVAALLPLLAWWTESRPPSTLRACLSGVFWGLLLLTKVQGVLLPPIVFLWAVWQFRSQGLRPIICWTICGGVVFLLAWPWLWLDPIHNLQQYLGYTLESATNHLAWVAALLPLLAWWTWVAALLPLLAWWTDARPPSTLRACLSGLFWGLLLFTKVQGVLLAPIVFLWAVWQFRWQSLRPLLCWSICGGVVFLLAWPWLWLDPIHNLQQYLGRTSDRPTLYCWYFGERFADKQVPWHYSFVMTLFTLPVGVVLCLLARIRLRRPDMVDQLLLLSIAVPLIVFALPGTPVYDGNRLFLIVMPAIAVLAARAFCRFADMTIGNGDLSSRSIPGTIVRWQVAVLFLLALQPFGSPVFSPYAISQYGPLAGGSNGAAWMGMESSYWSDGLNGSFWEQVPENSTVFVAPVSHQFQLQDIMSLVPIVQQRNIRLVPYEYDPEKQKGLLLLIHRLADLRPELRVVPPGATVVAEARLDHVVLARLIDTSTSESP